MDKSFFTYGSIAILAIAIILTLGRAVVSESDSASGSQLT